MNAEARFWEMLESEFWTVVLLCLQFGDTGKAKVADLLAQFFDIIIRAIGGANAGNTVSVGDKEFILHLLPAGMLRRGKLNIIGQGVALEPRTLLEELAAIARVGLPLGELLVSRSAKLVLPQHIVLDRLAMLRRAKSGLAPQGEGSGLATPTS